MTTAILALLVLVVLYFTSEIVLPIIFAFLLNLLLQPTMTALIKVHIPRTLAALFIILVFIGAVMGIGFSLWPGCGVDRKNASKPCASSGRCRE